MAQPTKVVSSNQPLTKNEKPGELEEALTILNDASGGLVADNPAVERRLTPREPKPVSSAPVADADFQFQLNVIEAGMAATLTLIPAVGKGKPPELTSLIKAIKAKNIKYGLLEAELKELIDKLNSTKQPVKERVIAWGRPAEAGKLSELVLVQAFMDREAFLKFYPDEGVERLESYEKYEKWAKVKSGDELAKFTPCHKGEAGSTVMGTAIPVQVGVDLHSPGPNVAVEKSEDGTQFIWRSEGDGIAVYGDNKLSVFLYNEVDIRFSFEEGDYSAMMQLNAPIGVWKIPNQDILHEALKKEGITYGLHLDKIKAEFEIFIKERKSRMFVCATGVKPREGALQEISFHVDMKIRTLLEEDEFGNIDYRIRQNAILVNKARHLCTVKTYNPEERKGITVKGKKVYPNGGQNILLKPKKGISVTKVDDLTTHYFAELDGELVYDEKTGDISVSNLKVVPAVDLAFGHLTFIGDVEIQKNIEDGMKVFVDGDLYVKGMILGAQVEVKGNLSCEGGINTKKDGFIKCGKDLRAKFLDQSRIHCLGSVKVEKGIMQSRVACLGNFEATGPKSVLQGGSLQVKGNVTLQNIGSESGTQTLVHLGADYLKAERYHAIIKEIKTSQEALLAMDKSIQTMKAEGAAMTQETVAQLNSMISDKNYKLGETLKIRDEGKLIFDELQTASHATLLVKGKAYPQNTIRFGGHDFLIKQLLSNVKMVQDPDSHEIVVLPQTVAKGKK